MLMMGFSVTLLSFATSLFEHQSDLINRFGPLEHASERLHDASQKLDFLVDVTTARILFDTPVFWPFARGILVAVGFVGFFYLLFVRKASFICINDTSRRYIEKYGKNYEFIKYGILGGLIIAIVGGVFASRFYDLVKPWL
jgi:hypothetical protein